MRVSHDELDLVEGLVLQEHLDDLISGERSAKYGTKVSTSSIQPQASKTDLGRGTRLAYLVHRGEAAGQLHRVLLTLNDAELLPIRLGRIGGSRRDREFPYIVQGNGLEVRPAVHSAASFSRVDVYWPLLHCRRRRRRARLVRHDALHGFELGYLLPRERPGRQSARAKRRNAKKVSSPVFQRQREEKAWDERDGKRGHHAAIRTSTWLPR